MATATAGFIFIPQMFKRTLVRNFKEMKLKFRHIWILLLVTGICSLVTGAFTGNFSRVFYFSTQICLSCMGLV